MQVTLRILPALVLAVALLAGCADNATLPPTPGPSEIQEAVRELNATLAVPTVIPALKLGGGAGEPNIAVAPNGTIYITPIDRVYRSVDAGKSFEALGTAGCNSPFFVGPCPPGQETAIADTDGKGDGDIAIDATGRIHWLGLFGQAGPIPYQYSDDQGETWSKARDLSSPEFLSTDGTGSDREWIDARPEGIVYASWRDSADSGIIATRTSFDGGVTWGNVTTMAPDAVGGPIVHGPKPGQVYEAMTTFSASPVPGENDGAAILLGRSFDNGSTWDTVPVVIPTQSVQFGLIGFPTSIFPVASVDEAGNIYVVFSADQRLLPTAVPKPAARLGVYLTSSSDLGLTWSAPILVSDPAKAAVMPFIAAGAAGRAAITWYENTAGLPNDALPDAWNVKLWESITANATSPTSVTVQLNELPNHIGSICTAGTGCIAGGDRSLLDFFEVALDNNGQPVVAYSSSAFGTAVGVAAQGTDIYFGTVVGTALR